MTKKYWRVDFSYIELHAVKHALQERCDIKSKRLEELCTGNMSSYDIEEFMEMGKLDKDLKCEKELIERIKENISDFKELINRHNSSNIIGRRL